MCLAAIAHGLSLRFPWVLASNRDEFFARAVAAAARASAACARGHYSH